jgi:hypothetical protein
MPVQQNLVLCPPGGVLFPTSLCIHCRLWRILDVNNINKLGINEDYVTHTCTVMGVNFGHICRLSKRFCIGMLMKMMWVMGVEGTYPWLKGKLEPIHCAQNLHFYNSSFIVIIACVIQILLIFFWSLLLQTFTQFFFSKLRLSLYCVRNL